MTSDDVSPISPVSPVSPKELLFPRLRCPDCFCESLTERVAANDASESSATLSCDECGRELVMTNNLLNALPSSFLEGSSANLAHYDEISGNEENELARRSRTRNHRTKMDLVIDRLGLETSANKSVVLEIGAGNGAHGAAIVKTGNPYVGLDISSGSLSRAPLHYPELQSAGLLAADATRTPFRDDVFDAAFGVGTIHHLPEPQKGIEEVLRTLKPNGRFCFIEPKRFYPVHFIQALRFADTEISAMKMSVSNLKRWARVAGASEIDASYAIYTPNGPAIALPLWNFIDSVCERVPLLHTLSVMFCVHGRK